MALNKTQFSSIIIAVLAFSVLYFGCDTKTEGIKKADQSRALNMEATSIQNIMLDVKKTLTKEQMSIIEALNVELKSANTDDARINLSKRLSSTWYEVGQPIVAGHYAEEIAKIEGTEESWSIAGTSYLLGVKSSKEEKFRDYASTHAITAFESAMSINPENMDHQINKALCFVENPVTSPMEGIMMLRKLNEDNPKSVKVINQLAKLAIRTNQMDRAIERLLVAVGIDSENNTSNCLLAQAYEAKNDAANAQKYAAKCN